MVSRPRTTVVSRPHIVVANHDCFRFCVQTLFSSEQPGEAGEVAEEGLQAAHLQRARVRRTAPAQVSCRPGPGGCTRGQRRPLSQ